MRRPVSGCRGRQGIRKRSDERCAREGDLWVTLQVHINIVAVAGMKELAGIVLINGREPEAETLKKAESENIPILVSKLSAFELIGRLYKLGISGT